MTVATRLRLLATGLLLAAGVAGAFAAPSALSAHQGSARVIPATHHFDPNAHVDPLRMHI